MIRSFDKGNFRFLVAASVHVYLWIWVEAFQQERINDPRYPPPSPQCQGTFLGSGAFSYVSGLVFILPTGKYSLDWKGGKGPLAHLWNLFSRNSNQNSQINFWGRLTIQQQKPSSTSIYITACKAEGWQKCPPEYNTLSYLLPSVQPGEKNLRKHHPDLQDMGDRESNCQMLKALFSISPPSPALLCQGIQKNEVSRS